MLDDKLKVREASGKFVEFGDQNFDDLSPGKTYKKFWINTENGIITNYSTIRRDSVRNAEKVLGAAKWNLYESNFKLVSSGNIRPEELTVSGQIENPLSNKIYIRFLDEPFGTDLRSATAYLDNKGSFSTTFDFSKKGLIYIENENPNRNKSNEKLVMYAEPGDSIRFITTGTERPWNLTFKGSRINESNLILELRKKIKLGENNFFSNREGNQLFDRDLYFGIAGISSQDGNLKATIAGDYDIDLIKSLDLADKIASPYKYRLDFDSYTFITNEVKAFFYSGIFIYLRSTYSLENQSFFTYTGYPRKSKKI